MSKTAFFLIAGLLTTTLATAATNGDHVLYFGDSHSVNTTLRVDLQKNLGSEVSYYASCGSSASHWLKGGYNSPCGDYNADKTIPLSTLQQQHKPNKVVIELGDNMFNWKGSKPRRAEGVTASAKSDIEKLVATIDDKTPCLWVGPTWGSKGNAYFKSDEAVNQMYKLLHETIGARCTIVDCRNAVPRDKGDGLHHSTEAANRAWSSCIIENTKEQNIQPAPAAPATNTNADRTLRNRQEGLSKALKDRMNDKLKFHEAHPTEVGR